MTKADIGLIGLAVMGQNLVLNMSDHNTTVAVFNRTTSKVDNFLDNEAKGRSIIGAHSLEEFFKLLKPPRRAILMVKAGDPVDDFINQCLPYLEAGDILIDGGNSLFTDTMRRHKLLKDHGILFVGSGISGGEEGARHGPSLMPGGNSTAWPHLQPIFQKIAAKAPDGSPCCDWIGDEGAGHYVKMIHNGIEYGDMQLICEAYALMSQALDMQSEELHEVFTEWNSGELNSYLIEITATIFKQRDDDGTPLIEKILDTAGQKGTGKWTGINALEMGSPLTLIAEAVFSRCISAMKNERVTASSLLTGPENRFQGDKLSFIEEIRQALYASKIVSYAQGFALMQQAAKEYGWSLNLKALAKIWRGGCIIRSIFLDDIANAYENNPNLTNLMLDDFFLKALAIAQQSWRNVVATAVNLGIPTPCFASSLAYYDAYRSERLPANLLQAQRDFFGAHTYERIDRPRGEFFHTNWTGSGGVVSSSSYNV